MKKIIFIFLFLISYPINSSEEKLKELKFVDGGLLSYDFKKVCIEGFVFYFLLDTHQAALANKLDENGKPVKCNTSTCVKTSDGKEVCGEVKK